MQQSVPRVTVILVCAQADESVTRTFSSLAAQTLQDFEVLVAAPEGIITPLSELGCRFLGTRLRTVIASSDPAEGWDEGIAEARSPYLCFLTTGDWLDPTYLDKVIFCVEVDLLGFCLTGEERGGELIKSGTLRDAQPTPQTFAGAAFVRRTSVTEAGIPDTHISSPHQIWEQMARSGVRGRILREVLIYSHETVLGYAPPREFGEREGTVPQGRVWECPGVLLAMPFLTMGGAERAVSEVCGQLKRLGVNVFLVTTLPLPNKLPDTTEWFQGAVAGIYHLPRFLRPTLWPAFVLHLINQHAIQVVWQVGSLLIYDLLNRIKDIFPDIAVVDLLFNTVGHTGDYAKYRHLIDHIVVEHDGMKQWLLEAGVVEQKVSIISNGVDLNVFRPQMRRDLRTGMPRPPGGPITVGFAGRLSKEKGPDVFIEIAANLKGRFEVEFVICGTGPMEAELRGLCRKYALEHCVHFAGFVPTVEYLPRCDLMVVCSRMDGRPNIVMESFALGIPVVASRVGNIPFMAPEGEGARLCDAGDVRAFCRAIEELATDEEVRLKLGTSARDWAEKNFSLTDVGKRYATVFRELVKQKGTSGHRISFGELIAKSGLALPNKPLRRTLFVVVCRFLAGMLSPRYVLGNVRSVWLYRILKRDKDAARQLALYFNPDYYRREYAGVAGTKIHLFWHYVMCGFREGCNPSNLFDTDYYIAANPDVAAAGVNPLIHYLACGRHEGRSYLPNYDDDPSGARVPYPPIARDCSDGV